MGGMKLCGCCILWPLAACCSPTPCFWPLKYNRGLYNWRIHITYGSKRTETGPLTYESSSALHRLGYCRDSEHCLHNQGGLATEGIFLYPLVMSGRAMVWRRWGSWIVWSRKPRFTPWPGLSTSSPYPTSSLPHSDYFCTRMYSRNTFGWLLVLDAVVGLCCADEFPMPFTSRSCGLSIKTWTLYK